MRFFAKIVSLVKLSVTDPASFTGPYKFILPAPSKMAPKGGFLLALALSKNVQLIGAVFRFIIPAPAPPKSKFIYFIKYIDSCFLFCLKSTLNIFRKTFIEKICPKMLYM